MLGSARNGAAERAISGWLEFGKVEHNFVWAQFSNLCCVGGVCGRHHNSISPGGYVRNLGTIISAICGNTPIK